MSRLRGFLFLGFLVLPLGACASGGLNQESGDRIAVTVKNTVVPPTIVTVWIVKDFGMRERLGNVTSNDTGNFRYALTGFGQYQLVATSPAGADVVSQDFTLTDASSGVTWDIGAQSVVVR